MESLKIRQIEKKMTINCTSQYSEVFVYKRYINFCIILNPTKTYLTELFWLILILNWTFFDLQTTCCSIFNIHLFLYKIIGFKVFTYNNFCQINQEREKDTIDSITAAIYYNFLFFRIQIIFVYFLNFF